MTVNKGIYGAQTSDDFNCVFSADVNESKLTGDSSELASISPGFKVGLMQPVREG
jgi:hypothetical protein